MTETDKTTDLREQVTHRIHVEINSLFNRASVLPGLAEARALNACAEALREAVENGSIWR